LRSVRFRHPARHGFLWQRWCVEAVRRLGAVLTGTSNVLLAMDNDLEAIGTNAHELPMVAAALRTMIPELRWAPYASRSVVLITYGGNLLIAFPTPSAPSRSQRRAGVGGGLTGFGRTARRRSAEVKKSSSGGSRWAGSQRKSFWFFRRDDVGSIEETYRHLPVASG